MIRRPFTVCTHNTNCSPVLLTLIGWSGASKHPIHNFLIQLLQGGRVAKVAAFPWRRVNSCTRLLTSTRCLNISEGRTLTQCSSCCHGSETLCAGPKYGAASVQKLEGTGPRHRNAMEISFFLLPLFVYRERERETKNEPFINLRQLLFSDECQ